MTEVSCPIIFRDWDAVIYDAEGRKLDYSRVGQYAVLPGLYPKVTVRVGGQAA